MPLALQPKILRALQERVVRPVGGTKTIPVDVRIISATHTDLEGAVEDGGFRHDLYYRLKGLSLVVPPLRERHEDIVLLANHFLDRFGGQRGGRPALKNDAVERLLAYPWPGNVRELENAVTAAASMCTGLAITARDLPLAERAGSGSTDGLDLSSLDGLPLVEGKAALVEWFEVRAIGMALAQNDGNISAAARQLGLHRQSLQKKMNALGIKKPS